MLIKTFPLFSQLSTVPESSQRVYLLHVAANIHLRPVKYHVVSARLNEFGMIQRNKIPQKIVRKSGSAQW